MIEFRAEIYKLGINPCVDVPERVSEHFGIRGNVLVRGTINGHGFRATLVPTGGGQHRLYVNTGMRKGAGVDVGDAVDIKLQLDTAPRILPIPEQLALALEENPTAKEAWEGLAPSRRKEILAYLNSLKRPESLERNVRKVIAGLMDDVEED